MKDQYGYIIRANDFVQVDDELVRVVRNNAHSMVVATLDKIPSISTIYGYAWQKSIVKRRVQDFSLLIGDKLHLL